MAATSVIPFPSPAQPSPIVVQTADGKVFAFDDETAATQFETSAHQAGGETLRLVPARVRKSLFEIESDLEALQDTVEMVAPEQQEEFLAEFRTALQEAKDKRDRVHWFMSCLEAALIADDLEAKRIQKRKARHQATLEHLDNYVQTVIKGLGQDAKGKWKPLEGNTVTLKLKNNPPSVAISDEAAVPARFKTVTVTLPAELWEQLCDSLDDFDFRARVLDAVKKPASSVVKTLVKQAIAEQVPDYLEHLKERPAVFCDAVPGAAIASGGTKLVRE